MILKEKANRGLLVRRATSTIIQKIHILFTAYSCRLNIFLSVKHRTSCSVYIYLLYLLINNKIMKIRVFRTDVVTCQRYLNKLFLIEFMKQSGMLDQNSTNSLGLFGFFPSFFLAGRAAFFRKNIICPDLGKMSQKQPKKRVYLNFLTKIV